MAKEVEYLGHVISEEGIATDQKKIEAVKSWPVPQHKTDVRAFLGTTGYYRKFIPGYAELAKPLAKLTGKLELFRWTPECQSAFDKLKETLSSAPILTYPDYSLPFVLDTDASDVSTGAVLSQIKDGTEKVVAYYSKTMTPEERNYCVTRKELLAIVKAVKHFRPYLLGRKCTIRTDHASLVWLLKTTQPNGQLARWLETLSDYDFELVHRKGLKHNNVDGLSRQRCKECKQCQKMTARTMMEDGNASQTSSSHANLQCQLIHQDAVLPRSNSAKSDSVSLHSCVTLLIPSHQRVSIPTAVMVQVPEDTRG
jgi:hypothetical protein